MIEEGAVSVQQPHSLETRAAVQQPRTNYDVPQSQVCEFLIGKMDSIDQQDDEGKTALFPAVAIGHQELCQLLLDNGIPIE